MQTGVHLDQMSPESVLLPVSINPFWRPDTPNACFQTVSVTSEPASSPHCQTCKGVTLFRVLIKPRESLTFRKRHLHSSTLCNICIHICILYFIFHCITLNTNAESNYLMGFPFYKMKPIPHINLHSWKELSIHLSHEMAICNKPLWVKEGI